MIEETTQEQEVSFDSQESLILSWLQDGYSLTPMQALNSWGCWALSQRVTRLRKRGYNIHTKMIKRGNKRFAQYFMDVEREATGQMRIRDINQ